MHKNLAIAQKLLCPTKGEGLQHYGSCAYEAVFISKLPPATECSIHRAACHSSVFCCMV